MNGKGDLATVLEYVRKAGYYEAYSDWLALDLEEREGELDDKGAELERAKEKIAALEKALEKAQESIRYWQTESEWLHKTLDGEGIPRHDEDGEPFLLLSRLVMFVSKVKGDDSPSESGEECHKLLDQWDVPRWMPGEGWLSLDTRLEKFMEGIRHGG